MDQVDPLFNDCPQEIIVQLDPLECERVVDFTIPTANDVCNNGGFQNNFAPANWLASHVGSTGSDGSVDLTNAPFAATFTGSSDGVNNEKVHFSADGASNVECHTGRLAAGSQRSNPGL